MHMFKGEVTWSWVLLSTWKVGEQVGEEVPNNTVSPVEWGSFSAREPEVLIETGIMVYQTPALSALLPNLVFSCVSLSK